MRSIYIYIYDISSLRVKLQYGRILCEFEIMRYKILTSHFMPKIWKREFVIFCGKIGRPNYKRLLHLFSFSAVTISRYLWQCVGIVENFAGVLLPTGRLLRAILVLNTPIWGCFVTSSHRKDQSGTYVMDAERRFEDHIEKGMYERPIAYEAWRAFVTYHRS